MGFRRWGYRGPGGFDRGRERGGRDQECRGYTGSLSIPIALQLTALAAGAASYRAITAGLAATTVSLAKRSPSELKSGSIASEQDLLVSNEP